MTNTEKLLVLIPFLGIIPMIKVIFRDFWTIPALIVAGMVIWQSLCIGGLFGFLVIKLLGF